jgi:hypothetical protein
MRHPLVNEDFKNFHVVVLGCKVQWGSLHLVLLIS